MTSPTPDAGVRRARPDDADAIGRVQAAAWSAGYEEPAARRRRPARRGAWPRPGGRRSRPRPARGTGCWWPRRGPTSSASRRSPRSSRRRPTASRASSSLVVLLVTPGQARSGHGSRLLNASADVARDEGAREPAHLGARGRRDPDGVPARGGLRGRRRRPAARGGRRRHRARARGAAVGRARRGVSRGHGAAWATWAAWAT
nr:hypothetical protein [Angustibacter aerolatus]